MSPVSSPTGFLAGARAGLTAFMPASVGLIPWALVVGMAMISAGFTPLEAMGRGAPVVSARNSSLPEVLGDAAEWVDGYDAEAWAAAIRGVLNDSARAARLRAAGFEQAKKFTWEETARRTWEVYRRVG